MKKFLLTLLLCLLFLPAGLAEEEGRLYPAMDDATGLWGYIDGNAQWVIAPQFAWAGEWRGGYASAIPGDQDPEEFDHTGIIDRQGNWVLEPRYTIQGFFNYDPIGGLDGGLYLVWQEREDDERGSSPDGFFDVPSGFFSGLIYDSILSGRDDDSSVYYELDRLIPVDRGGRIAYVDRHTGEEAFALPENVNADEYVYENFRYGYAMAVRYAGEGGVADALVFNEEGTVQDLGGLEFAEGGHGLRGKVTAGGILRVYDPEKELYGYWDLNAGDFLIPPQFAGAEDFSASGYACVMLEDGTFGHIDQTGAVLARGFSDWYEFWGEYAQADGKLIDAAGNTVLQLPAGIGVWQQESDWEDQKRLVSPDGLLGVYRHEDGFWGEGVMNLSGEWVLEMQDRQWVEADVIYAGYERFFPEGLQSVTRLTEVEGHVWEDSVWKYAWMNTAGEFITDFIYDDAGAFLGALAPFERDGLAGYIDQNGREVILWHTEIHHNR